MSPYDLGRQQEQTDLRTGLTSREFLYHLPCERSARKLNGFGSEWLAPETAVRADRFAYRRERTDSVA
ncbi:MAG: hypothetical protein ACREJN_19620 [Nitrospiraceae bacterium]